MFLSAYVNAMILSRVWYRISSRENGTSLIHANAEP